MRVNIIDEKLIKFLGRKEIKINCINQNKLEDMISTNRSKIFLLKNKEFSIDNLYICLNEGEFYRDPYLNKKFDIKDLIYINDNNELFSLI